MNIRTKLFFLGLLIIVAASSYVNALPQGPVINYVSNSTAAAVSANSSGDEPGTITVLDLDSHQQDYKWKAYVGNVTGKLALDDSVSATIYDWTLGTVTGEVYVTRSSTIGWANITCANETVITNEDSAMGVVSSTSDSINLTFNYTSHKSMIVGTKNISNSTCRSTATYVSDTPQTIDEVAAFQEILLADSLSGNLVYGTFIENDATAYNGDTYDFQLIVAENESASVPTIYYFYVELG
jgi:hypothetical protein